MKISPLTLGLVGATALVASLGTAVALQQDRDGYTDTPFIPGQKWRVHDKFRPYPPVVTPGEFVSTAPSDAEVLFDGKDLSHFEMEDGSGPKWKLVDGTIEVVPGSGYLFTKEKFGDCQLHIEWRESPQVSGRGQGRGNSGVFLMNRYEIQVLDSYKSATYADGQAGAIYGQWPPLVNPMRPPGDWQAYDIVFHAAKMDGAKVAEPAYVTVFFNGVLIHEHQKINGPTAHAQVLQYEADTPAEDRLSIQDHHDAHPMRFRNIWIRRLKGYDSLMGK